MVEFLASQKDLQNALAVAIRAVPTRTTNPILENVLLDASGERVTVTGNDMEKGIETSFVANITEGGTIAVNAKMFFDIVRKLPDELISFSTNKDYAVLIKCGKSKFTIVGQSGDTFPRLNEVSSNDAISLPQGALKNAILKTIFSVSTNESNKTMTGEYFVVDGDTLTITALDGHRIAVRNVKLSESYPLMEAVIPGETLQEISKIMYDDNSEITVVFAGNYVLFEMDEIRAVSRQIDGKFFDMKKMLSQPNDKRMTVNSEELQQSLERALLFVKENVKVPIIFDIKDDEAILSIKTTMGSYNETIPISKEGEDLCIGFNPKFLLDALKAADGNAVTLYLSNNKSPCYLKDEDETYNYVVLPVNFQR